MRPNCEILMRFIMPCKRLRSKSAFNMRPPKIFGGLKNEEGVEKTPHYPPLTKTALV